MMNTQHNIILSDIEAMEKHAELINGNLVIEDKTTVSHNSTVSDIATAFRNFIASNGGDCKVFQENVALYCNELLDEEDASNYFLPDVMVVCDKAGIKDNGIHVAPKFVAEVTSPNTQKNDYGDKMLVYRNIGVEEYWIVDLQKKIVTKYLLTEEFVPETYLHPEAMKVSTYEGLVIDLSEYM